MIPGNDWNKHHAVGSTLIDNWVEERAVGDAVLSERDVKATRAKSILEHSKNEHSFNTTQKASYGPARTHKNEVGKRRQHLEAEILKKALQEAEKKLSSPLPKEEWASVTKKDFFQKDYTKPIEKPSQELLDKFDTPITFWTDHAAKANGITISSQDARKSTPDGLLGYRAGMAHQHNVQPTQIKFGKNTSFSTPIHQ